MDPARYSRVVAAADGGVQVAVNGAHLETVLRRNGGQPAPVDTLQLTGSHEPASLYLTCNIQITDKQRHRNEPATYALMTCNVISRQRHHYETTSLHKRPVMS